MSYTKFVFKLAVMVVLLATGLQQKPVSASSLASGPFQINTPTGSSYRVSGVKIAGDNQGLFAIMWAEDTINGQFLVNEFIRFRVLGPSGLAIGQAAKLVGTSSANPKSVGIQAIGPNKFMAFWSDRPILVNPRFRLFRQLFNAFVPGQAAVVFTDTAAKPIALANMTRLSSGKSLLTKTCACFPVVTTGQFIDTSGVVDPILHSLSPPSSSFTTLNFRAVAGGGFVGSFLKDGLKLAGRAFHASGQIATPMVLLPVKFDQTRIEGQTMFGLKTGGVVSLVQETGTSSTSNIWVRTTGLGLGTTIPYMKLLSNVGNRAMAAVEVQGDQYLLAYSPTAVGNSIKVARYNSIRTVIGNPVTIVGSGLRVAGLYPLVNGKVVLVYTDSQQRLFDAVIQP